jgi:hypothetical protein
LLAGMVWDALLHDADPGLAAREGILDSANPSHLLIALGLGLTVAGVGWGLVSLSAGRQRHPARSAPALAAALLLSLVLAMGAVAIATESPSGQHSAHAGVAANDAVLSELKGVLIGGGTEKALARLEDLAAHDESLTQDLHHYVHELGAFSYSHYGDADKAFHRCDKRLDSGCYHGVVLGYLRDRDEFRPKDLAAFCNGGVIDATEPESLRFQCLHGLGHGLMAFFDRDLRRSLRSCDILPRELDRGSCQGGAFMEDAMSGAGRREALNDRCSGVAEKHKASCYVYAPRSRELLREPRAAFEECDRAPGPYVGACYQGVGGAIGVLTGWDPREAHELCVVGSRPHRSQCFEGMVAGLLGRRQRTDEAFALCAEAPADVKGPCFEVLGTLVGRRHTDRTSRSEECDKAEGPTWVAACRQAAGLSGNLDPGDPLVSG